MKKWVMWGAAIAVLLAPSVWWIRQRKGGDVPKYRLAAVDRGDVTATVTATGTLNAVTTVKVGSQVSGIISKLHADFNSRVRKGELLAELDPTSFAAQVDGRRADLEKAKVEARNSRLTYERSKKLLGEQLVSQQEFDAADLNLRAAEATVAQAEASLHQAESNLSYTKIVSPIEGVVVERQYDVGQTVAASFQAPTLFTIAQDLTKMQVSINVDEADVGRIQLELPARFTVDAYPDRTFEGKISQIRLATQTVQNVVTYPVLLDVANPDLGLKPGMTANVSIPVETKTATLRVPNAALRFHPDPSDVIGEKKEKAPEKGAEKTNGSAAPAPGGEKAWGGRNGGGGRKREGGKNQKSTIYLLDPSGKLKPVPVRTSITDGNYTAFESDEIHEGDQIVTGLATTKASDQSGGLGGGGMGRGPRGPR